MSEIDRCKRCGRDLLGGAAAIVVNEGTAHFSGVETCGRLWAARRPSSSTRARLTSPVSRPAAGSGSVRSALPRSGLGNEIARSDMKGTRRKTSRTPLQILADFGTDGLAADLDLWHEYER
ncbi:hypothetical protein, partial [Micromonospora sp. KC721]|uniref:hypothetical protein n=1 Tax=Micromonospora sp. KC721 TaxID=2530380 RepID=UPI001A9EEFA1